MSGINVLKMTKMISRHPTLSRLILFVVVWLFAAVIFFARSPDNLINPNFYAEDGQVFTSKLLDQVFPLSLFSTFNGYFVVGLYTIGAVAIAVTNILGNGFVDIPAAIAIMSYLFFGFCVALPIITLRRYLKPTYLALLVFGLCFVPMPNNDYVVIGTLGNLKFAFAYIAALLVAYRWSLNAASWRNYIVDAAIVFCCYTTATAYVVLPFYLLSDGIRPKQLMAWRSALRWSNRSLIGAGSVLVLAVIQLVYVALHGIPKLPGYLDTAYQTNNTIELFGARTVLYPFVATIYNHLGDVGTILLLAALLGLAVWRLRTTQSWLFWMAIWTALLATALFTLNRPGVSGLFDHYRAAGPDQFFYAQSMVMLVAGAVLIQELVVHMRRLKYKVGLFATILLLGMITVPHASTYGSVNFMEDTRGTIYSSAKRACLDRSRVIDIAIYPIEPWEVTAERARVCTSDLYRHATYTDIKLGTEVLSNQPANVVGQTVQQVFDFDAKFGKFAGLNIFFSTYSQVPDSSYEVVVYQADCKKQLRATTIPGLSLHDNQYHSVKFSPLTGSGRYCFTVRPTSNRSAQPLAMQISGTNPDGLDNAAIGSNPANGPVVFDIIAADN